MKQEIVFFDGFPSAVRIRVNAFIDELKRSGGKVESIQMQGDRGSFIVMVQYLRNRDYGDD